MSRELWLQDRKKGVGGSEIASVLNIGSWGCSCNLWDEKRDVPEDNPDIEPKKIFKRGTVLEPHIIDEYIEETGHKVIHGKALVDLATGKDNPFADRCNTVITIKDGKEEVTFTMKDNPHRRATIDGLIVMPDGKYGILECKTAFREMYYKFLKEGLADAYNLQGQFYCGVLGLEWGSYAVLWPDGWEFLPVEFQADKDLINMVFDEVDKFWKVVESGPRPDRLAPDDTRCKKCTRRRSCQGDYILQSVQEEGGDVPDLSDDQQFAQAAHDYMEAKEIVDGGTILLDAAKDTLKDLIGTRPVVMGAGLKIHYKPQKRVGWDTKKLAKDHPELEARYKTKESVSRPFKPFII